MGEVYLKGLTIFEAQKYLYDLIFDKGLLVNHNVDIKLLNSHFTVLEVNNPGTYEYIGNNMNILKALGIAGDLTINGKRNDLIIIRNIDGKKLITNIDLTKSDYLNSDLFQIHSRDIIIVNPNSTRVKNAGIIGNSGTLISLLSFLLSSIIVINN